MNKQRRFNTGILLIIASMLFISGNLLAQQQPKEISHQNHPAQKKLIRWLMNYQKKFH